MGWFGEIKKNYKKYFHLTWDSLFLQADALNHCWNADWIQIAIEIQRSLMQMASWWSQPKLGIYRSSGYQKKSAANCFTTNLTSTHYSLSSHYLIHYALDLIFPQVVTFWLSLYKCNLTNAIIKLFQNIRSVQNLDRT